MKAELESELRRRVDEVVQSAAPEYQPRPSYWPADHHCSPACDPHERTNISWECRITGFQVQFAHYGKSDTAVNRAVAVEFAHIYTMLPSEHPVARWLAKGGVQ